ncbi:murein biosynthesis integral membrane protein MurJ [Desulfoprunum benzoelyticum]|nr:murein biosynthesis integral membrane protein MurJ [Desulfoprunum benzoelyticum]
MTGKKGVEKVLLPCIFPVPDFHFRQYSLKNTETTSGGIARSAATVGVAVLCSRILGLIREQVFAAMFGAGLAYDSFVVAFRIPNLLRDLFGEGALSAAFVTVFADYDTNRGKKDTWRLASNVLTFFAIALSLISLIGIYLAEPVVALLAPDFSLVAGKTALTVQLTRIMLPFLVFISLAAVVMGMLNTQGRFFVPAMASSFFNLGSIIGGVGLAWLMPRFGQPAIVGMACGTLIGGIMQLAVQLPALAATGFRFRPALRLTDPGLVRILLLMAPATIGLSATQINIFINTNFASSCAEGSVSWLNYAFRLVQLPIGLFGVALSIAMMPVLARHAANKDIGAMRGTLASSLNIVFCLTLPATAGLILLADPIIRLIFEHGAFTAADTVATASTLSLYAIGLFAYSANKVLVPAFYAINRTRYPVIASFLAILFNIVIITVTIDRFQHLAIAFSTSCTMLLNFVFLTTVLYWKMGGFNLGRLATGLIKILIATAIMSLWLYLGRMPVTAWLVGNVFQQLVATFSLILSGTLIYGVMLFKLGMPELDDAVARIRSRLSPQN